MAGQVWSVNSTGGFLSAKNLSKVLRMATQPLCKYRQFCDVQDASLGGYNRGDTFRWDTFSNLVTAGAALTESVAIPQTNFAIAQSSLTVTEYGNSVPYTGKLDNLSEIPVENIIKKVLKHDCVKTLDTAAYNQFALTPLVFAPAGGTSTTAVVLSTTGTTAVVNNVAFGLNHAKAIEDTMKERNTPAYIGDDYVAIARTATLRPLKNDLEQVFKYTQDGFGMLLHGEVGRYGNTRFVEQTNIASKGWTNGMSDEIIFMGEDTVAEAVVTPEEIRGKIPADYGRDKGVAWFYFGGFGLSQTSAAQARVYKWGSAS